MIVHRYPDLEALSEGAAKFTVNAAHEAISRAGRFEIALAGGSTPRRFYELLASPAYAGQIDWSRVWVLWSDERWVPPSEADSNEGMARSALLDRVPIPASQVFPMYRPGSVEDGASAYEEVFRAHSAVDLAVLGVGDDGHTASLFPGIPELEEEHRFVVPTLSPKGVSQRLTLTIPALQRAATLLFLVSGADKAEALSLALGDDNLRRPPSGVVAMHAKRAVWYVDDAAAASLL